jgi:hypothetical protein
MSPAAGLKSGQSNRKINSEKSTEFLPSTFDIQYSIFCGSLFSPVGGWTDT